MLLYTNEDYFNNMFDKEGVQKNSLRDANLTSGVNKDTDSSQSHWLVNNVILTYMEIDTIMSCVAPRCRFQINRSQPDDAFQQGRFLAEFRAELKKPFSLKNCRRFRFPLRRLPYGPKIFFRNLIDFTRKFSR